MLVESWDVILPQSRRGAEKTKLLVSVTHGLTLNIFRRGKKDFEHFWKILLQRFN